jgi:acetoin utilization protein AcuB
MRAAELMTKDPTSVTELTTVNEALDLLYERDIRHLPVVRGGELVGILSDRDLRRFRGPSSDDELAESLDEPPENPTVSTLMNTNPAQVDPETEAGEIVELMLLHRVGALPVVDSETNELVGIVSYVDLLRLLEDMLKS